jgi:DNA-binding response OmpR family regulator
MMSDSYRAKTVALRVAISDGDIGFVGALTKRLDQLGWEHRVLFGEVRAEGLVGMRLGALVVDPAVLGPHAWEELERVTRELPALPVLICTRQSTVSERVRGLRLGADDWVTKPCHPEELIARINAAARRGRAVGAGAGIVLAGEIEVRPDLLQVWARGTSIDLTRREFALIRVLAAAEGRVLEREEIYRRVCGYTMAHGDRGIDVFVRRVRSKLRRASPHWSYIQTHFGVGYRFEAVRNGDDRAALGVAAAAPQASAATAGPSDPIASAPRA